MYTVAIAPMVLGAALAYVVTGVFPATCGDFVLGGILVIAWLNLRYVSIHKIFSFAIELNVFQVVSASEFESW